MRLKNEKIYKRARRRRRVRKKVFGTPQRPRLSVFRSARHIYAQVVDDTCGRTIASASSLKLGRVKGGQEAAAKITQAREVGKLIAETAKGKGITKVTFDRGGCLYHGRIAALAESARESGLEF